MLRSLVVFFFKQKTAYELLRSLVGSEMCIRDSYRFGLYSIGLACTLSVWPVLNRFGLSVWPVLYRFGLFSIGLACTLSVWPVLYRFGLYSIGFACTLSVWLVIYRFGLY